MGSDADIVVWDPDAARTITTKTHHSVADFNIFDGMNVRGLPIHVIVGGLIMVKDGQVRRKALLQKPITS